MYRNLYVLPPVDARLEEGDQLKAQELSRAQQRNEELKLEMAG